MFKRILLPTDGSPTALQAARVAAELSKTVGGTVHPIVAVEYHLIDGEDVPEDVAFSLRERVHAHAQRTLDRVTDLLQHGGAAVGGGKICEGRPAEVVNREAEQGDFDLIVIGSRGISLEHGYERLVGSVAERVLHRAPCPVLVVRGDLG